MYKLILTDLAEQDLDKIVEYISMELKSPKAATDFLDEVEKCYDNLETMPKMYPLCRELDLNVKGYRKTI